MANSVFQKVFQGASKVVEDAAPIVGGVIGGAFGGPAGAAAGAAAGRGAASVVKKVATTRALGGSGQSGTGGGFVPSSSRSIDEARTQDKSRMRNQYGM